MPPPLNILSLATLFPDAARPNFGLFVERSLSALARQDGVRLTVVAPIGLPPWPLSQHDRYRALTALPVQESWRGLNVRRPRFWLVPRLGARWNPAMVARAVLADIAAQHSADPFHVIDAQFFYPDGPAAMRIGRSLRLPWSIKARGADISHFGHHPATRPQIVAAAAGAGGLLAVSAAMREDMAAIGIDPAKVAVHYTGIDAARFTLGDKAAARRTLNLPLDVPILVSVGALIPRKGQDLVIRALSSLPQAHYVLAGAGVARGAYQALARERGVAARVRFLGPVANADLPRLYQAADVVVMPSVSEGLANAWVEALACGTPLVISDAGGAVELVTSPIAGRIAARDPAAIAAAVQAILNQPPAPADVAATLAGRFDWDRNGAELAAHLRRIAGR